MLDHGRGSQSWGLPWEHFLAGQRPSKIGDSQHVHSHFSLQISPKTSKRSEIETTHLPGWPADRGGRPVDRRLPGCPVDRLTGRPADREKKRNHKKTEETNKRNNNNKEKRKTRRKCRIEAPLKLHSLRIQIPTSDHYNQNLSFQTIKCKHRKSKGNESNRIR